MSDKKLIKGTVCFLINEGQVLLGLINYGDGDKKWNGFGGVIEVGESSEEGVVREIEEEIKVRVEKENLLKLGRIKNTTLGKDGSIRLLELDVFTVNKWEGKPVLLDQTIEELRWFNFEDVPYEMMFEDNRNWLHKVLAGEFVKSEWRYKE